LGKYRWGVQGLNIAFGESTCQTDQARREATLSPSGTVTVFLIIYSGISLVIIQAAPDCFLY